MKQLLEWLDTQIERHKLDAQYAGEAEDYEEGVVFGLEEAREEIAAAIASFDIDGAAEAMFLAGLPTGRSGELLPGHTTWDDLGPKAKERQRCMASAAIDTIRR